jgi:hypothetical protein
MGWWLGLVVLGCGPDVVPTDDHGTASTTASQPTTAEPETSAPPPTTSADTTAGDSASDADAELCLQWCLNASERGCPTVYTDEACYTRCLNRLESASQSECDAEYRELAECEAQAGPPAEPTCEAVECEDAYKRHELCVGFCFHLGGSPGSSASPESCEWRSSCYGQQFEIVCPVGDAGALCSCLVDDEEIAQCEVGMALESFECEAHEIHVFSSCCREAFEGVWFP